ncbi:EF-hand domain-containing protein [Granulibacter bethesdensis]|nr:EF-hand domain-containing protein [Granulibacter bethesdensis]
MRKTVLMTAAFGLSILASQGLSHVAMAAVDATPHDTSLVMSRLDPDNDGTVSLEEAHKAAEAKFDALDTDHEGTLDASELTGILGKKALAAFDPDHDGSLDKAEWLKLVDAYFKKADPDHDGTLSPAELTTENGRALVALLAY